MASEENKLKVLFWRTDFYGALTEGGIASLYTGLTEGFNKLGHECVFVSSGRMNLPDFVNYYYVPYSELFRNFPEVLCLPYNRKTLNKVKEIIEIEKPDFIYQHNHDFSFSGSLLKKDTGIPFFLHVDSVEYWVKKNWGKLYFGSLLKWAEEIQFNNSDAIFVISEKVKEQLIEMGIRENKIFVNPNGVNTDFFKPEVDGSEIRKKLSLEDKFIVGFIGTFGNWHGVDILAESAKFIKEKIDNSAILFVGDGNLRPEIERTLKRDGTDNISIITGLVPYWQIPSYMAACDVLTTPCVNNEDLEFFNSPIKLFEYMGMGKPIIATDVGQQGEIIHNGENGLLCEVRSPEKLADAVLEIYRNRELAGKISRQAREDAVAKHDWTSVAQNIIDVYSKITG